MARELAAIGEKDIPHATDTPGRIAEVRTAGTKRVWGEILRTSGTGEKWDVNLAAATALSDTELVQTGIAIATNGRTKGGDIPVCRVEDLVWTGPRDLAIKGREAPCEIEENWDGSGLPAMWHHKWQEIRSVAQRPNARVWSKKGREQEYEKIAGRKGRLHIATELGHAPQSVGAVMTDVEALGVASWNTLRLREPKGGAEEALALWWNSTLGLLVRICYANRPYLGRSRLPIESIRQLPVLDVRKFGQTELAAAKDAFERLATKKLKGFADMLEDETRLELDAAVAAQILGWGTPGQTWVNTVRNKLSLQPAVQSRH